MRYKMMVRVVYFNFVAGTKGLSKWYRRWDIQELLLVTLSFALIYAIAAQSVAYMLSPESTQFLHATLLLQHRTALTTVSAFLINAYFGILITACVSPSIFLQLCFFRKLYEMERKPRR